MKSKNIFVLLFCFFLMLTTTACKEPSRPVYEEPTAEKPQEPVQPAAPPVESTAAENTEAEFNLSNANQIPPGDVLDEVTYYSGGGRGSACEWVTTPTLVILSSVNSFPQEWMDTIDSDTCGWQDNEALTVTVIYPDATQTTEVITAYPGGDTSYDIIPTRRMQPGRYTITIQGTSGYVEGTTEVVIPNSPRMYSVAENWLVLYGFSPFEKIRLFAYQPETEQTMRLEGWNQYQVDSTGKLFIQSPGQELVYYAVGDISGLVTNSAPPALSLAIGLGSDLLLTNCGGLASRLIPEARARVAFTDGSEMRIREKPGFSENISATVPEGTPLAILGSRKCADNSTWWKIRTDDGLEGWMAEEQNGIYLLEPDL